MVFRGEGRRSLSGQNGLGCLFQFEVYQALAWCQGCMGSSPQQLLGTVPQDPTKRLKQMSSMPWEFSAHTMRTKAFKKVCCAYIACVR